MKLLTKIALTAAALLCATTLSNAQPKFGYINSQEIIYNMPEIADVQLQLEKLQKDLEEQLEFIQVEYNNKLTDYQKNAANYSDAIRQSKEQELMGLQQRYEELGKAGSQDMQKKQGELMTPLIEKARATINKIAAEQALTAVFDMAAGSLAYIDEAQMVNLAPAVKKEFETTEYAARLKATGVILSYICPLMYMNNPLCKSMPVMTSSNKLRTYTTARYYTEAEILEKITKGGC